MRTLLGMLLLPTLVWAGPGEGPWREWLGVELSAFSINYSLVSTEDSARFVSGPHLFLRAPTLSWGSFYWTLAEVGLGTGLDLQRGERGTSMAYGGSQGCLFFSLGAEEKHLIALGASVGAGWIGWGRDGCWGPQVCGVLRWSHRGRGPLLLGMSLRSLFPLPVRCQGAGVGSTYPAAFLVGVDLSWEEG